MRLLVRLTAALSVLAFTAAAPWAYAARNDDPAGPVLLLGLGTAAALLATGLFWWDERRPRDLVVPDQWREGTAGGTRLPAPEWWVPVGAAGLADLALAPFVSIPLTVTGGVLLLAAVLGGARWTRRERSVLDRHTVRGARAVRDFAVRHASGPETGADAVVENLGEPGARIVLVGADGTYGDVTSRGVEPAELAVRMAGARVHETFPPDVVARIKTGPYEWTRMAGIQLGGPRAGA
jgi:hypothetical protein